MKLLFLIMTLPAFAQTAAQKGAARDEPPKISRLGPIVNASGMPEEAPKFKRKYVTKLTSKPGISLSLECEDDETWGRGCYVELRQADEKSVHFYIFSRDMFSGQPLDPSDKIAENILDPVIVPETKRLVAYLQNMDRLWRIDTPREFKDEHGVEWVRK